MTARHKLISTQELYEGSNEHTHEHT